ncbi:MAG: DUF4384 domain-containing protein [Deferribacterales bacterium]
MRKDGENEKTVESAISDARKNAIYKVINYTKKVTSENIQLNKISDIETIIISKSGSWDREPVITGDCYKAKGKFAVNIFNTNDNHLFCKNKEINNYLYIDILTNKEQYKNGDNVKLYLKSNKPFYGIFFYKDSTQKIFQILPNKFRETNLFDDYTIYEIPTDEDRLKIIVDKNSTEEYFYIFGSTKKLKVKDQISSSYIMDEEEFISKILDIDLKTDNPYQIEEIFFKKIPVKLKD